MATARSSARPSNASSSAGSGGVKDVEDEYQRMYPTRSDPREYLSKRTPEEVFDEFDTDGSGELDLDEFITMLPALGILVRCGGAARASS